VLVVVVLKSDQLVYVRVGGSVPFQMLLITFMMPLLLR
jgi:hypothetical protein